MSATITGISTLNAELRNLAERSSRGARAALKQGAQDIRDLAIQFAPVDVGNLDGSNDQTAAESAIKTDSYSDKKVNGRTVYVVFVDTDTPAPTRSQPNKTVGDYADWLHENRSYNLGEKSLEKQRSSGLVVGPKYLERALDQLDGKIRREVERRLAEGIGH